MNEPLRRDYIPDRNTEYLIYQTMVGVWPIDPDRKSGYILKAIREAKAHTSWTQPNEKYEEAVGEFVKSLFESRWFMDKLEPFVNSVREAGRVNSLSAVLLKITTPGVPDFYQGTEIWEHSLVDPDNRRPVNYEVRRRLLSEARDLSVEQVWRRAEQGISKLWLTWRALGVRRSHPEWLGGTAEYRPLLAEGPKAEHVLAFVRGEGAVVVVPRLPLKLAGKWDDTTLELPQGRWLNELTGETIDGGRRRLSDMLAKFPVALLTRLAQA
jgi:(1->4)-alpha-D-glucan 1-alpha-D-glucosylmutase